MELCILYIYTFDTNMLIIIQSSINVLINIRIIFLTNVEYIIKIIIFLIITFN